MTSEDRDGGRRITLDRQLVAEGAVVLRYIFGRRPPMSLVRRYVRAVRGRHGGDPLDLPELVVRVPPLLRLLEPVGEPVNPRLSALSARLQTAVALAEASPEGAVLFCNTGKISLSATVLRFLATLTFELVLLPFRFALTRLAR